MPGKRSPAVTILAITLVQASALFVRSFTSRALANGGMVPDSAASVSALLGSAWALLLLSGWLANRNLWQVLCSKPPQLFRYLGIAFIVGVLFRALDWLLLIYRSPGITPDPGGVTFIASCTGSDALYLDGLVLAGVTPLVEEIVFRGLICRIACRISVPVGIVTSATLFAIFHPQEARHCHRAVFPENRLTSRAGTGARHLQRPRHRRATLPSFSCCRRTDRTVSAAAADAAAVFRQPVARDLWRQGRQGPGAVRRQSLKTEKTRSITCDVAKTRPS
jgi:membrane protease YdiL (CAAX protease family)